MLIIMSTDIFHPILTMNTCWTFHIVDHEEDCTISKAMHWLNFTMAAHTDVKEICYGLRHLGGLVSIQGYIKFFAEKNQFMVMQLLPGFQLQDVDYYEDTDRFVDLLHENSVFVKMGNASGHIENGQIVLDVEWHYINPTTDEHVFHIHH